MTVNYEMEVRSKGMNVAYFNVIYQQLARGTEENQ
jgi:hypothetical protein